MKHAFTFVVALFIALIGVFIFTTPIYICDKEHPTVSPAKNLSPAKLTELFNEVEYISRTRKDFFNLYLPLKTRLNLNTLYGVKTPTVHFWTTDHARVKLAACFDHSVSLELENLNRPSGSITLHWGEGPESGEALLWKKSQ
jgi:hypothetical protein